ncbi:MAG: hypothetical protein UHX00_13545 [Caryophanon sp.]|nr:hypothetical protein [Caryophanon sp.]
MKAKTINVQIVKNCGNYESIRIGGEWELNGESVEQATQAALAELNAAWELCKKPTPQVKTEQAAEQPTHAADGRQIVTFQKDNELLQKIVKRVQKTKITIDDVLKHYALDDEAQRCVEAAIKLRG